MLRTAAGSSHEQHNFTQSLAGWIHPRLVLMVVLTVMVAVLNAAGEQAILLDHFLAAVVCSALAAAGANILVQVLLIHGIQFPPDAESRREKAKLAIKFITGYLLVSISIVYVLVRISPLTGFIAGASAVLYIWACVRVIKGGSKIYVWALSALSAGPVIFGWLVGQGNWNILGGILAAFLVVWTILFRMIEGLSEVNYRYSAGKLTPVYGPILARRQIVWFTLLLVIISLLPLPLNFYSPMYFVFALISGAFFIQQALRLFRLGTRLLARQMAEFSAIYLATLLFLMVFESL